MGRAYRTQRWGTIAKECDLKDPGDNLRECCSQLPKDWRHDRRWRERRHPNVVADGSAIEIKSELERPVFTLRTLASCANPSRKAMKLLCG
jgi:hypothetical protein